jgi:Xaa-Pro dipeptidase
MYASRFERLARALRGAGFDAAALNPGPTLRYLTGLNFHLMERPTVLLFVPGQEPGLIAPGLEINKVKKSPVDFKLFTYQDNPQLWPQAFEEAARALNLDGKKIGVEPTQMRFLELSYLQNAMPNAQFADAGEALAQLRMQKDKTEVEAMRQAVRIAQQALQATLPVIKPGVTERQIAAELTIQLLRAGSEPELPFPPIVSGGPNSADPHASPSERALQTGDLLVIDWGAAHDGYVSDLTRTFAIGEVEPEYRHIAELVRLANQNGRAACKPGIPAGQVDAAAREVIEEGGYGKYFFHRTGHGVGMEGHEGPYIFGENTMSLAPGMAFTVEPGIYLPGRGGVRIEDNVVITEDGVDVLSDLPRELITLQ